MNEAKDRTSFHLSRATILEGIVGLAVLGLAFGAMAATDVTSTSSLIYWNIVVLLAAGATLANEKLHGDLTFSSFRSMLPVLLHWVAVLVVVHLVYFLVSTGRMANADTGLATGLMLTLGLFLSGVHGNWRMMVLGVALGLLCTGMAIVEEYIWVLFGVAVLGIGLLVFGSRMTGGHVQAND